MRGQATGKLVVAMIVVFVYAKVRLCLSMLVILGMLMMIITYLSIDTF